MQRRTSPTWGGSGVTAGAPVLRGAGAGAGWPRKLADLGGGDLRVDAGHPGLAARVRPPAHDPGQGPGGGERAAAVAAAAVDARAAGAEHGARVVVAAVGGARDVGLDLQRGGAQAAVDRLGGGVRVVARHAEARDGDGGAPAARPPRDEGQGLRLGPGEVSGAASVSSAASSANSDPLAAAPP